MQHTDDRTRLVEQIQDKAVVHGKVTLSSGREADYYVDLRRVTLDAEAAPLVGRVMRRLTADLDYDAVGGLTLGADPVACAPTACCHLASRFKASIGVRCARSSPASSSAIGSLVAVKRPSCTASPASVVACPWSSKRASNALARAMRPFGSPARRAT